MHNASQKNKAAPHKINGRAYTGGIVSLLGNLSTGTRVRLRKSSRTVPTLPEGQGATTFADTLMVTMANNEIGHIIDEVAYEKPTFWARKAAEL